MDISQIASPYKLLKANGFIIRSAEDKALDVSPNEQLTRESQVPPFEVNHERIQTIGYVISLDANIPNQGMSSNNIETLPNNSTSAAAVPIESYTGNPIIYVGERRICTNTENTNPNGGLSKEVIHNNGKEMHPLPASIL